MKLRVPDYVVVIVEDLDRALGFYTGTLGLELGHRSGQFAQLATGATRLALFERSAMARVLGAALRRRIGARRASSSVSRWPTWTRRSPSSSQAAPRPQCRRPIGPGGNARRTCAIRTGI